MPGMSEASGWHPPVSVVALGFLWSKPLLILRSPSHLREFLTVHPGSPHPPQKAFLKVSLGVKS